MNYSCARLRVDGRWYYTRNGRPCGYCLKFVPTPLDAKYMSREQIEAYNAKMLACADKFHDGGHATEEEACECYKQYLLDHHLRLQPTEPERASQQHRCKICDKWTSCHAMVGACHAMVGAYRMFDLCPEHQTRECVEKLFSVGESWES